MQFYVTLKINFKYQRYAILPRVAFLGMTYHNQNVFLYQKDIDQIFFLMFDTGQYFRLCQTMYCALAYLLGSKFGVHKTLNVLSNLVDV